MFFQRPPGSVGFDGLVIDYVEILATVVIPEPSTALLLAFGLVALGAGSRWR